MNSEPKKTGFSLAEVLLAIGTLAVGVLFVAGVFPVGIHLTTVAIERTIAAIAADEAFAKVKLYAIGDPNVLNDDIKLDKLDDKELKDFNDIFPATAGIDPCEFTYPSTDVPVEQKHYYWTALCRDTNSPSGRLVQVTVFVCRKVSPNLKYYDPNDPDREDFVDWPRPVKIEVSAGNRNDEIVIDKTGTGSELDERPFINNGYTIVDDRTGRLYRVLERYTDNQSTPAFEDAIVLLDRNWDDRPPGDEPQAVWVVPPPTSGGRGPCIGVYQKVIRF